MLYYRQVLIKPGGKIPVLFTVVVSVEIGGHSTTMLSHFRVTYRYTTLPFLNLTPFRFHLAFLFSEHHGKVEKI